MAYANLPAAADATKAFGVDRIGTTDFPRTKIAFGAEGNATDVAPGAPLPVAGTVALHPDTLAALENVTVALAAGGIVGLDPAALAALESITASLAAGSVVALDAATLAALESITVGGTVALDAASLAALEQITVTLAAGGAVTMSSAQLPSALGATTAAQSLSVAPATDATFATVASGYARVVPNTAGITRLANATPYAAGQVVGGSAAANNAGNRVAFPAVSRVNGGVAQLVRLRAYKSTPALAGKFHLVMFRGDPAAALSADGAAFVAGTPVGNAAAAVRAVGRFAIDFTAGLAGSDGVEVAALPATGPIIQAAAAPGSADLFGVLLAADAYTPVSGEQFSFVLEALAY